MVRSPPPLCNLSINPYQHPGSTLADLLNHTPQLLSDHTDDIIPRLLALAQYKPNMVRSPEMILTQRKSKIYIC